MLWCLILLTICSVSYSQMIRQCSCQEFEPCKQAAVNSVMQCADQCQNHVVAMGASYPAMRSCLLAKEPMITSVMKCEQNQLTNACSRGGGGMVPKRYPETLKIAAYSEINSILTKSVNLTFISKYTLTIFITVKEQIFIWTVSSSGFKLKPWLLP
uniref:DB domain-containing protein n=1 Tax=Heterorhabditis bacteriophora TaxID=37862 RepID=A0A1I7WB63_HETBA